MAHYFAEDPIETDYDPSTADCPGVNYRDALSAMFRLRHGYDDRAAMQFKQALEGDEAEVAFQTLLADPAGEALLKSRPSLAESLDDWPSLARLPEGSLGHTYHSLAARDGIRALDLIATDKALSAEIGGLYDPARAWLRARQIASHDLLHVLTDYERDVPGELLVIAFTHAFNPKKIFPISFVLGLTGVPLRHIPLFLFDAMRAWRRGRHARIDSATKWEELLRLPIDNARELLGIASTAQAHKGKIWREGLRRRRWRRVHVAKPRYEVAGTRP